MFEYDPYQKGQEEIIATFISGKNYLSHILADLQPVDGQTSNQGIVIIGQRGTGKSHFLKMLYYAILNDGELKKAYFPVLFPEELFKVNSLFHLLRYAIEQILSVIKAQSMPLKAVDLSVLENRFQDLQKLRFRGNKKEQLRQRQDAEAEYFLFLKQIAVSLDRKLIFLLENLQDLMGKKLTTDDLKRLRAFLQEEPETLLIIGSALTVFDSLKTDGEPFYNYFNFRRLTQLTNDEILSLLAAESRLRNRSDVLERIDTHKSEIEVFSILTGGNPRLCLFLYDLLAEKEVLETQDILNKITQLTPYFKERTDNLSPGKQLVIDALCQGPPAMTVSEIAEYTSEPVGIVSENTKRLDEEGLVKKIEMRKGRDIKRSQTFYCIKDYFYRIWYQVRQAVFLEENIVWMSEIAVILFKEKELSHRLECSPPKVRPVYESALRLMEDGQYMNHLKEISATLEFREERQEDQFEDLFDNGEWEKLLALSEERISEDKDSLEAYFYQGCALNKLGRYKDSVEAFRKAVEINPEDDRAWFNLGVGYGKMGRGRETLISLLEYINVAGNYSVHVIWAFTRIKSISKDHIDENRAKQDLISTTKDLNTKIKALIQLIALDKLWRVDAFAADLIDALDAEGKQTPDPALKRQLYYCLMAETIWQMQHVAEPVKIAVPAKFFLQIATQLQDDRQIDDKIREFIICAIRSQDKEPFNINGMLTVLKEWVDSDVHIPEVVYALIEAMGDPDSKTSQVWRTDPLFEEIFNLLSASDECEE